MTLWKRINWWGYKSGISHKVWHCIIAGLFLLIGIIIGNPFAGWASGVTFYWSREIAQAQERGGALEIWDAVYPTITNTLLLVLWLI